MLFNAKIGFKISPHYSPPPKIQIFISIFPFFPNPLNIQKQNSASKLPKIKKKIRLKFSEIKKL